MAPLRIPPGASLLEFDDFYTAPEGGFANAADYYARGAAAPRLAQIVTPGVILTASQGSRGHGAAGVDGRRRRDRVETVRNERPSRRSRHSGHQPRCSWQMVPRTPTLPPPEAR